MNTYKVTLLFLALPLMNLLANDRDSAVSQLLVRELEKASDKKLHVSWVYSGEGGAIRYAELDLVGDERKEIIYDRTSRGELHKTGKPNEAYYQPEVGAPPVKIEGDVPLYGFYKKEGGKSVFLEASEGRNFDTPGEKAFTRKLIIREVTVNGVTTTVHVMDATTGKELQEMWEAALSPHDQKSVKLMASRGFAYTSPKYIWVALKDFVSGDFEWKDYEYNNWSSLDEFSVESMTWKINKGKITPEFLELARHVRKILPRGEMEISYGDINLLPNYLTPRSAYRALRSKAHSKGKGLSALCKNSKEGIIARGGVVSNDKNEAFPAQTKPRIEEESIWAKDNRLVRIFAGLLLFGVLLALAKASFANN